RIGHRLDLSGLHILLQDVTSGAAECDQQRFPQRDTLLRLPGNQRGLAAAGYPFDQQGTVGVLVKKKGRSTYHIENKYKITALLCTESKFSNDCMLLEDTIGSRHNS